jgi:hypothetical protein
MFDWTHKWKFTSGICETSEEFCALRLGKSSYGLSAHKKSDKRDLRESRALYGHFKNTELSPLWIEMDEKTDCFVQSGRELALGALRPTGCLRLDPVKR